MTPARVRKGVSEGGQFAARSHPEAAAVLLGDSDRILANAARITGRLRQEQFRIADDISTLSTGRIALRTLQQFPDAATFRVETSYEPGGGMEILGVHDKNGTPIADCEGTPEQRQRFSEWAGVETGGENIRQLAADMLAKDGDWWKWASETDPDDEYNSSWDVDISAAARG